MNVRKKRELRKTENESTEPGKKEERKEECNQSTNQASKKTSIKTGLGKRED